MTAIRTQYHQVVSPSPPPPPGTGDVVVLFSHPIVLVVAAVVVIVVVADVVVVVVVVVGGSQGQWGLGSKQSHATIKSSQSTWLGGRHACWHGSKIVLDVGHDWFIHSPPQSKYVLQLHGLVLKSHVGFVSERCSKQPLRNSSLHPFCHSSQEGSGFSGSPNWSFISPRSREAPLIMPEKSPFCPHILLKISQQPNFFLAHHITFFSMFPTWGWLGGSV